jgi:hypothetical protein
MTRPDVRQQVSGTRAFRYELELKDSDSTDWNGSSNTNGLSNSLQHVFCLKDALAQEYQAPWLSYAALDQGAQELCVACSFSQAAFSVAMQKFPMLRTSIQNMLCPWVLY